MKRDLPAIPVPARHGARPHGICSSRIDRRSLRGAITALLIVGICCLAGLASDDRVAASDPDPARLILRDGQSLVATLSDVTDAGEVVFAEASGRRPVAMDDLVTWGAYADRSQATYVVMVDGSVLVTDILSIEADAVTVVGRLWQETRLPRPAIRAIVFHPPADPHARDQLFFRALAIDRHDERLLLENGDELAGHMPEVVRPAAGAFQLTQITWVASDSNQTVDVPLDRLIAVLLAPGEEQSPPAGGNETLVGLRDGSLIHVQAQRRSAQNLEFQLVAGQRIATEPSATPEGEPWNAVVMLQPLRAQVTYLSDLQPLGYRHIPFLEMTWPFRADRSVSGGRLRHAGHVWTKGLGMHSSSRLAYETGGPYRELHAEVAIDDRAGRQGSVIFRVYIQDQADNWSMAYESAVVRGGDPAVPIRVDLRQAMRLALIVDFADRADQWDHANWLNARLVGNDK
jgi:hypothetical protein